MNKNRNNDISQIYTKVFLVNFDNIVKYNSQ